jgi:uncharacterized protein
MTTEIERRNWGGALELRADGEGEGRKIAGHAAVFDMLSENLGGFREKVEPGAFADTIKEHDIRALFNHDSAFVLGRNVAGTLRLKEDKAGLAIEIDPPDTQGARDLLTSIERGDVSQMSFGFRTLNDKWEETADGDLIHTLLSVRLFDVSPVTYPAYPDTDVAVRSLDVWQQARAASAGVSPMIMHGWRKRRLDLLGLT